MFLQPLWHHRHHHIHLDSSSACYILIILHRHIHLASASAVSASASALPLALTLASASARFCLSLGLGLGLLHTVTHNPLPVLRPVAVFANTEPSGVVIHTPNLLRLTPIILVVLRASFHPPTDSSCLVNKKTVLTSVYLSVCLPEHLSVSAGSRTRDLFAASPKC